MQLSFVILARPTVIESEEPFIAVLKAAILFGLVRIVSAPPLIIVKDRVRIRLSSVAFSADICMAVNPNTATANNSNATITSINPTPICVDLMLISSSVLILAMLLIRTWRGVAAALESQMV